ncbi:LPS assembly lipoprotein LptE [Acidithiobacillus caldus]
MQRSHRAWALRLALTLLGMSLSACGFHLPTGSTIPPRLQGLQVLASGPAGGSLATAVERELALDGNRSSPTAPVLDIRNAYVSQRIISISPSTGVALEFLNTLHAEISLRQGDRVLLPPEPLLVEHSFSYSSSNPLATNVQQEEDQRLLFREAARDILRRILYDKGLRDGY